MRTKKTEYKHILDHKEEMDRAWDEAEREAEQLWKEIQARQGPSLTREQLEERRKALSRVP